MCNANARAKESYRPPLGKCDRNTQGGGCKSIMIDNTDSEVAALLQNAEEVGDSVVTESVDSEGVKTSAYTCEVIVAWRCVGFSTSCSGTCGGNCGVSGCNAHGNQCNPCYCNGSVVLPAIIF